MKSDCIHRNNPEYIKKNELIDKEYSNFKAEIVGAAAGDSGAGGPSTSGPSASGGHYGPGPTAPASAGDLSASAPWNTQSSGPPAANASQPAAYANGYGDPNMYQQYYQQYYQAAADPLQQQQQQQQ